MKKGVAFFLVLCLLCPLWMVVSAAEAGFETFFKDREQINVVALGGSITASGGVTDSWGKQVSGWLEQKLGKPVCFYNTGIGGTGSDFGLMRLHENVVSKDPDLVFVEFSVNDRGLAKEVKTQTAEPDTNLVFNPDTRSFDLPKDANGNEYYIYQGYQYTYEVNQDAVAKVKGNMEQIIRQLLDLPKRPVVILNYVGIGTHYLRGDERGERLIMPRPCKEIHEEIAQKYQIPSIDIDSYVQNIIKSGAYTQEEIFSPTDCVHPSTLGRKVYSDYMIQVIEQSPEKYLAQSTVELSSINPEPNTPYQVYVHGIPYTMGQYEGNGWVVGKGGSAEFPYLIQTRTPGDSVTFTMQGTYLGLITKPGGSYLIRITNADGSEIEKTVSQGAGSAIGIGLSMILPQGGTHMVTITHNTGVTAIASIVTDQQPGTYLSYEEFNQNFETAFVDFTADFNHEEGLKNVVDTGWIKDDSMVWEVENQKLKIKAEEANAAVYHDIPANSNNILNISFKLTNPSNEIVRFYFTLNGETAERELLGILPHNAAGVFQRDAAGTAVRFSSVDQWVPQPISQEHQYRMLLNYKANDFRLYVDGVESGYVTGAISSMGGTTAANSGIEKLKLVLGTGNMDVWLDDFFVTDEIADFTAAVEKLPQPESLTFGDKELVYELSIRKEYLIRSGVTLKPMTAQLLTAAETKMSQLEAQEDIVKLEAQIAAFPDSSAITIEQKQQVEELWEKAAALMEAGAALSPAAQEKLKELKDKLEQLEKLTEGCSVTPSRNNTGIVGCAALFRLETGEIQLEEVTLDQTRLIENLDYFINENQIKFSKELFQEEKRYPLKFIFSNGGALFAYYDPRAPLSFVYRVHGGVPTEDAYNYEEIGNCWQGTSAFVEGTDGQNKRTRQNYGSKSGVANETHASYRWYITPELKGTFQVDWFDVRATVPADGKERAQAKVKVKVASSGGVDENEKATNRNASYLPLGTYTFSGVAQDSAQQVTISGNPYFYSSTEYVEIFNTAALGMGEGCRLYADALRFTQIGDDTALEAEFVAGGLDLSRVTLSASTGNSGRLGQPQLFFFSDASLDYRKLIKKVQVNGKDCRFQLSGDKLLLEPEGFTLSGPAEVTVFFINGGTVSCFQALKACTQLVYTTAAQNVSIAGFNSEAGPGHSRSGSNAPKKISKADIQALDQTHLDDLLFAKWELGGIAPGDYLIDVWMPSFVVNSQMKVEIKCGGGSQVYVFHDLMKDSGQQTSYHAVYLGNGQKFHFTGAGEEYVKIMLDDHAVLGQCFLADSIRLTPFDDYEAVYELFYGSKFELAGLEVRSSTVAATIRSNLPFAKAALVAYCALYDSSGRMKAVRVLSPHVLLEPDGDTVLTFDFSGVPLEGLTPAVFVWGGENQKDQPYEFLKPYLQQTKRL